MTSQTTTARIDTWVARLVTAAGAVGIVVLVLMLVFIAREAVPLLFDDKVSLAKLLLPQPWRDGREPTWLWQPVSKVPKVSLVPLLLGSLKVALLAMMLAAPVGLLAAIFSAELASRRVRNVLKPLIELLASVPSVVLGFFALMTLSNALKSLFDWPYRLNTIVAGVALSLAVVPVIFTLCDEALRGVPASYREASYALGASKWVTAVRIVLPAAYPSVAAAMVLGLGRAMGETMIVLMASGNAPTVSLDFSDSTRTLSATIAAELGELSPGTTHASLLYFFGVVLFFINLALTGLVRAWLKRVQR